MENRTLAQAKELVNSSFPTIFSKEDVMNLLNSIEDVEEKEEGGGKFSLTVEQIEKLAESIASDIEDQQDDIVDTSDLDFDIDVDYDRRINIEVSGGATVDTSLIESIADRVIRSFIDDLNDEEEAIRKNKVSEDNWLVSVD